MATITMQQTAGRRLNGWWIGLLLLAAAAVGASAVAVVQSFGSGPTAVERAAGFSVTDAAVQARALNEQATIPHTTSSASFSLEGVLASKALNGPGYPAARSFLEEIAAFRAVNQPTLPRSPSVRAVIDLRSLNG